MRDLPYFPLYASNQLADKHYRLMSLLERGLWISMLMECWPNRCVPAKPTDMAKYLGLDAREIETALSVHVLSQFKESNGSYISPEIEDYRAKVLERRAKQVIGGKEGANRKRVRAEDEKLTASANSGGNLPAGDALSSRGGRPSGVPTGDASPSLSQVKSNSFKSTSLADRAVLDRNESWLKDYESPWPGGDSSVLGR